MLEISNFLGNQKEKIIQAFINSGKEEMEIPGIKGIFISKNNNKGDKVIYISQFDKDGITYYLYQMNPV